MSDSRKKVKKQRLQLLEDVREPVEFVGTPIECMAWLRKRFDTMRNYVKGWHSTVDDDGNLVPTDEQEDKLGVYDRSVWRVTMEPTEHVATDRMRDSMVTDCMLLDTERELLEALMPPVV